MKISEHLAAFAHAAATNDEAAGVEAAISIAVEIGELFERGVLALE